MNGDNIHLKVNGVDFVMDEAVMASILDVPTEGILSIEGTCSTNFRKVILKPQAVQRR